MRLGKHIQANFGNRKWPKAMRSKDFRNDLSKFDQLISLRIVQIFSGVTQAGGTKNHICELKGFTNFIGVPLIEVSVSFHALSYNDFRSALSRGVSSLFAP